MGLNEIKNDFLKAMKEREDKVFFFNDNILKDLTDIYKNSLINILIDEGVVEKINDKKYLFIETHSIEKVKFDILKFIQNENEPEIIAQLNDGFFKLRIQNKDNKPNNFEYLSLNKNEELFLKYALKKLEDEKYILKIDSNEDNSKVVYIKLKGKEDDWGIAG